MTKPYCSTRCPLCTDSKPRPFFSNRGRNWLHCPQCDLVFVDPEQRLSAEAEKARYDLHRNDPNDPGYRSFLNRLALPLSAKLPAGACGLDFGCGPGATLSTLFQAAGFSCADYDLYYARYPERLDTLYDFIACSETAEHFHDPKAEFEQFLKMVKPGGWIGMMTQLREPDTRFQQWFYKDDPTHVCIFSKRSFQWLAKTCGLFLEFHPHSVMLFQKPEE